MASKMQDYDGPILECRDLCISYFTRAGEIPAVPFNLMLLKQCQVVGVNWGAWASKHAAENDALFAELLSLYELDSFDAAVAALRDECEFAAITVGAEGCVIVTPDELVRVPAVEVDQVIDTTGAGDLFAAGFLHGWTRGHDLETCGRFGAVAAAEVITHVGPRPLVELRSLIGDE